VEALQVEIDHLDRKTDFFGGDLNPADDVA
jgi:hypothetical protein